jgi:signal transduction histidine kinase
VLGRLDRSGRLIAADPALEALQREAGSALGDTLALPQIAAVAQLARELGTAVGRRAIAAGTDHDVEMWVNARPEGDEIALSLEGWTARPAGGTQLAAILAGGEAATAGARYEWATDEELRMISLSPDFAELLGITVSEAAGMSLTRLFRLEEDELGEMPLVSALAARRDFSRQRARSRADEGQIVLLSGEVATASDGSFAGFRGTATRDNDAQSSNPERSIAFDHALDEVLRSPIDRIIADAERIVQRTDGPLRGDYASYGTDIAAAARHLLSVLGTISDDPAQSNRPVDLAALTAEAVIMLDSTAEEYSVRIEADSADPLPARGQERAIIQILVNLIGNAIRYSPENGTVRLAFNRTADDASVTIADEGPGIAAEDQQRIFERFERVQTSAGGTGLGLAISRRLARSMGGDVTLHSAPGEGARFTLTLPSV